MSGELTGAELVDAAVVALANNNQLLAKRVLDVLALKNEDSNLDGAQARSGHSRERSRLSSRC